MDDVIHMTTIHDYDWEAALVAKANGDVPDDEDSADEEEPPARPTLSARDAMSSVKDLLDFARVANDAAMIDAATSLENIMEMPCVKLPVQGKPPCSRFSSAVTHYTQHMCVDMYVLHCEFFFFDT